MFMRSVPLFLAVLGLHAFTAEAVPTSRPSSIRGSSVTYSGRVEITFINGTHIGFLNNTDNGFPNVDVAGTPNTDLEVKLSVGGTGPFDLLATNPAWVGSAFIGGGTDGTLSADSLVIVPLSNTTLTAPGSPPTAEGASAIWGFDTQTAALTPLWTNPDGSHIAPIIGWHKESNLLFFTGDESNIDGKNNIAVDFSLTE
ncbi:hypothetical protein PsYK624_162580 [Phanerochaete sordida]|uniref:DOMON domain-containing protein n=1 Tax=Phanerochaete sordida TaxID=48140 RepID=A0A9P3GRS1_9APHY|nr:hypothetical protein PsYK624_162580 [Phanerochaete sordida]